MRLYSITFYFNWAVFNTAQLIVINIVSNNCIELPPRVAAYDEPQDYYLLLGERYKDIKDTIRKAATVGRFDELVELLATRRDHLSGEWSLALHYLLRIGKCPKEHLTALLAVVERHAAGLAQITRAAIGGHGPFPAPQG